MFRWMTSGLRSEPNSNDILLQFPSAQGHRTWGCFMDWGCQCKPSTWVCMATELFAQWNRDCVLGPPLNKDLNTVGPRPLPPFLGSGTSATRWRQNKSAVWLYKWQRLPERWVVLEGLRPGQSRPLKDPSVPDQPLCHFIWRKQVDGVA